MEQHCNFVELLTNEEMTKADQLTIQSGMVDGYQLMQQAGKAVASAVFAHYPSCSRIAVLCGAGNNGGDGYVSAQILRRAGYDVICYALFHPKKGTVSFRASQDWNGGTRDLSTFRISSCDLIIDALFGAGLNRPLNDKLISLIEEINKNEKPVIAIDLPSGVLSITGQVAGAAIKANLTVTFFRYKLGHWLYPGRELCGKVILSDIMINAKVLDGISPKNMLNLPCLWQKYFPHPNIYQHKYSRGHVAVFSGPSIMTGAGRLASIAAQRIGAGVVTLLSPEDALLVNGAHLISIMLHVIYNKDDILPFIKERKVRAVVLGPGFSDLKKALNYTKALFECTALNGLVLDADALTAFQGQKEVLAKLVNKSKVKLVITPHEGEFARLFPDLSEDLTLSRIEKAQRAAFFLNSIVVYKGPDTIIAAPDGRIVVNANGTSLLATAGSGDVLSGMIAGLIAQGMPVFEAACASVWLHAECANSFGVGLISEDLPNILPKVLQDLCETQ